VSNILWIGSSGSADDIRILEQATGRTVIAAGTAWTPVDAQALTKHAAILVSTPVAQWKLNTVFADLRKIRRPIPVVIYDPQELIDSSAPVPALQVSHCVTREVSIEELAGILASLIEESSRIQNAFASGEPWKQLLIGDSRPMRELHAMIRLIGPRQSTVLITGETGTGKEMVARAIHMASKRCHMRMVPVNCAALPETLLEAELFGHVKGAFTGAIAHRVGRFEQANLSTIFLDEIGEMPLEIQAKLLRVLQEREVQRIGSSETISLNIRVIAASNTDLEAAIGQRQFRQDLFYRLNVVPVRVAPLRERLTDIPLLADHFVEKVCRREDIAPKRLAHDALDALYQSDWPGNVRELEHTIETAIALSGERETLYAADMRISGQRRRLAVVESDVEVPDGGIDFERVMGSIERRLLEQALRKCGGNKARAATILGLKRTTLVSKMKALEECTV
jgi:transcriptional regulator with GAF, ATPase, and Fis domain